MKAPAAQIERVGTPDRPQDGDEGGRAHHGQHQADAEVDQRLGGPARVVGDAVFGVGRLLAADVEVVEALARQPAVDQMLHEPGAPAYLQRLARDDDADADRRHGRDDQPEHEHGLGQFADVAVLQAVEKPAVPMVERHRGGGGEDQEGGQPERQRPGPEGGGALPEPAREPAERPHHAWIELEARRVGGLEMGDGHGVIAAGWRLRGSGLCSRRAL